MNALLSKSGNFFLMNSRSEGRINSAIIPLFGHALPSQRIVHECRGHKVRQHFQIAQFRKISIDFCRKLAAFVLQVRVQLEHFCAERFGLDGSCVVRLDDLDLCNRERRFLFETGEAHSLQTLQDQIRCAIAAADTGADQPDGSKMEEIFRCVPLWTARFDESHAKHAMMLKCMLEHLAVSRLENVEREQCVRKKHRPRKGHHRQLLWQSYG